ncbi:MAG: protoporphyrinogen oxidase HemJ [Rickettsiales endosymbiont of Dermacentor nuttalli]
MAEYYLWIKSFHVVAIISWMAGMLYLPRLYAYHSSIKLGSDLDKTFQVMENRLLRYIINPAMVIAVILGILLAYIFGFATLGIWFHLKMMLVIILFAIHGMFSKWHKDFVNSTNKHSSNFYKIINESVTLIMIFIVILVIVKPFSD